MSITGEQMRILILEDAPSDAALVERELRQGGLEAITRCVETEPDFVAALADFKPDIVLSDYSLPSFNGMDALRLVQQRSPTTPVIIVTGSLNEETAAECIKAGAADYVLKERLARLLPAVRGALERQRLEQDKRRAEEALRETEERYRLIVDKSLDAVLLTAPDGRIFSANAAACRMFGREEREICELGRSGVIDETDPRLAVALEVRLRAGSFSGELTGLRRDGTKFAMELSSSHFEDRTGNLRTAMIIRDISERRRAEEVLRESEERYRDLVEQSHDLICRHDLAGRFLSVNPAAARVSGYSVNELLAMSLRDVLTPEVRDQFESYLATVRDKGGAKGLMQIVTKSGERRIWEYDNTLRTEGVAAPVVRGLARDVTDRIQAEDALRKSEERYRTILQSIAEGYFEVDIKGNMTFCNDSMATQLGYAREELIGLNNRAYMDEANAARVYQTFNRVYRTGEAGEAFDWELIRKDGGRIVVETSVALLRDAGGRPVGFRGVLRDVTERKQAEQTLRESEKRFRSIFDKSNDGILVADATTRKFLFGNRAIYQMLGYTPEELVALGVSEIHPQKDLSAVMEAFDKLVRREIKMAPGLPVKRKDGSVFYADISSFPLQLEGGTRLIGIFRDITERKQAEEARRESEERYRLIAENTADMIWTLDLATRRFTYVSPSVERLRGFRVEEVLAQPFEASLTPESLRRVNAHLAAALAAFAAGDQSAKTGTIEADMPTKDGGTVRTEIAATALTDASGRVTGVLGVTRDITERKRAGEALRESEERYRSLFEQSPIGVYRTTPNGEILLANPALLQMLGYASVDELRSRNLEDDGFQPENPRRAFKDAIEREGKVRGFEAIWTAKDGRRVYVRENAQPIRDATGKVLYYEGTVEDVTAERESQEALRQSEAHYHRLFERANDAIMLFEPETWTVLDANPKACELYGYTRNELVATSLKRLIVDVARADERIAELVRGKQVQTFETVHLRRDGTPVDLEVNMSTIVYGGRPAVFSIARDITNRKRDGEERRRLVAAIEQSGEAVVITDSGGAILYVNPAFEWITGYRTDEVIGLNPRVLKSGKQDASFYAEMWTTITRGSVWTGKLSNRRKDGSLYEEEMSISPIRDESGAIINYVAVKRDVTREVELQQQLAQAQKMEAVGRLAGGVAHDFNNLLQALISHVELLRSRSNDPEKVKSSSREMEQLIGHGASLTRQLLLFSRRETVKPERLDLNEQVREASKMLKRLVKDNITLRVELAPESLRVDADRGQLDQVLMNLVVNASDAMPDGGELTIRTGTTNHTRVWLSVEDNGLGIPEEIRERIFEPFFTTKGAGKGTGLGLSVVHGIVTRHGGLIEVESDLGKGTTFKIVLPEAGSGEFPSAKGVPQAAAELPVGKGERILVVEDGELARQGLHDILVSFNYEVVSVGSGEAAGSLPSDPPFDLLLTDLMLPGVAGPQLAAGLKERWPALKVILMSGYTEDETIRSGVSDGTVRFLQKPFDMAKLAREVRAALEERD